MSKIPEHYFRGIIASVLSDLLENEVSRDSTEVSKVFLYFKNVFMQRKAQFCSITLKQIEAAAYATELHENILVELCRELGNCALPAVTEVLTAAPPAVVVSVIPVSTSMHTTGFSDWMQ